MTVRRTARAKGGDLPVAESDAMTHRIVALGNRGPEILAIREEMCVGVEIVRDARSAFAYLICS